jgi:hypothetical protein
MPSLAKSRGVPIIWIQSEDVECSRKRDMFPGVYLWWKGGTSSERRIYPCVSLGLELELSGVPIDMSAGALKTALVEEHLANMKYDFLLLLKKSSEEMFWDSVDGVENNRTKTARLITSNNYHAFNSGKALLQARNIFLRYRGIQFQVLRSITFAKSLVVILMNTTPLSLPTHGHTERSKHSGNSVILEICGLRNFESVSQRLKNNYRLPRNNGLPHENTRYID